MFQCPQQCPDVQGSSCTSHRAATEWERVLLGTWCSCPCTTTSICPVPQSCGHSCVPTPLLGTRHPTASLQQVKVEARGGRLLQRGGRSGHDSTHKAWHLQGRDGWAWTGISMWADRLFRRGDSRSSAVHTGQMKGESGRSNSRPEVSSRLGCLRKQVGGAIS